MTTTATLNNDLQHLLLQMLSQNKDQQLFHQLTMLNLSFQPPITIRGLAGEVSPDSTDRVSGSHSPFYAKLPIPLPQSLSLFPSQPSCSYNKGSVNYSHIVKCNSL